jgi:hypothetical protein
LGEDVDESIIVQKVLRSLPMIFDPKISSLEERTYLDSISMDELHGIFTAYEMTTEQENPTTKEETFKAYKNSKKKGNKKEKSDSNSSDISKDNEEVDNFVRRLKKGTNDKYRGKIPLICFMVLVILLTNVSIRKRKGNEEDNSNRKKMYKGKKTKNKFFKKRFCTKEIAPHQTKMKTMKVR